jgi:hypothetical protein
MPTPQAEECNRNQFGGQIQLLSGQEPLPVAQASIGALIPGSSKLQPQL